MINGNRKCFNLSRTLRRDLACRFVTNLYPIYFQLSKHFMIYLFILQRLPCHTYINNSRNLVQLSAPNHNNNILHWTPQLVGSGYKYEYTHTHTHMQ